MVTPTSRQQSSSTPRRRHHPQAVRDGPQPVPEEHRTTYCTCAKPELASEEEEDQDDCLCSSTSSSDSDDDVSSSDVSRPHSVRRRTAARGSTPRRVVYRNNMPTQRGSSDSDRRREVKTQATIVTEREIRAPRDRPRSRRHDSSTRTHKRSRSHGRSQPVTRVHRDNETERKPESSSILPFLLPGLGLWKSRKPITSSSIAGTTRTSVRSQLVENAREVQHQPREHHRSHTRSAVTHGHGVRPTRSGDTAHCSSHKSARSRSTVHRSRLAPRRQSSRPPSRSEKIARAPSVTSTRRRQVSSLRSSTLSPSKSIRRSRAHSLRSTRTMEKKKEVELECTACMCEYPKSKIAQLPCDHNMCNTCVRRLFDLSLTDPQHMPPKCCGPKGIPLHKVEKLFDRDFKKRWNHKQYEFGTKNRIYCPGKGCGTWIKPSEMKTSTSANNRGRKYGVCSRCKLKVCADCNGKWHSSRTCPKDPATQEFVKIAKERGWQNCYSCNATVELKEGCNHMTCRCKAEFCMICGAQWKTCECPWFNYGADAPQPMPDLLQHMNVPFVHQVPVNNPPQQQQHAILPFARPVPGQNPALNYQQEMDARREQERRDEEMARMLQMLDVHGANIAAVDGDHFEVELPPAMNIADVFPPPFANAQAVRQAQAILGGAVNAQNEAVAVRFLEDQRRQMGLAPPGAPRPHLAPIQQQHLRQQRMQQQRQRELQHEGVRRAEMLRQLQQPHEPRARPPHMPPAPGPPPGPGGNRTAQQAGILRNGLGGQRGREEEWRRWVD